jgi:transcriptional regulator with XRE-family HTH domain
MTDAGVPKAHGRGIPDPIDVAVGSRVRMRRKELKVSQGSLGDALGVSFQQIQKYERGTNRISASMLVRIADTLNTSVAALFSERYQTDTSLPSDAIELLEVFTSIQSNRDRRAVIGLAKALAQGVTQQSL